MEETITRSHLKKKVVDTSEDDTILKRGQKFCEEFERFYSKIIPSKGQKKAKIKWIC